MPPDVESGRQRMRTISHRRRMGMWALGSVLMVATALYGSAVGHRQASRQVDVIATQDCPKHFAGDSAAFAGGCWCGGDSYCMCTPSLAIDAVVEVADEGESEAKSILVIRRKDNGKLACIGGFVEVGETLEAAVKREVFEETGLQVSSLRMIPAVYDDPSRDARRHTVSVAFVVRASGTPILGKEEAEIVDIPLGELRDLFKEFAFDHSKILADYLRSGLTAFSVDELRAPDRTP